jgi:hypothetical protein
MGHGNLPQKETDNHQGTKTPRKGTKEFLFAVLGALVSWW